MKGVKIRGSKEMEVKLIGNDDVDETDGEVKQLKLNNDRKIYIYIFGIAFAMMNNHQLF